MLGDLVELLPGEGEAGGAFIDVDVGGLGVALDVETHEDPTRLDTGLGGWGAGVDEVDQAAHRSVLGLLGDFVGSGQFAVEGLEDDTEPGDAVLFLLAKRDV